ncbi:hypothetical protein JTE90_017625 [Oedothorax gibbosus]|uniref:Protein kinase domain-containing protein n=1 Tax=Oedothorax gibbosus TaxID=931172 RepID=A0AAV6U5F6_9ARAC|nr:hypothetical protein JTE90_017625 [Oedothorax gibbosus]
MDWNKLNVFEVPVKEGTVCANENFRTESLKYIDPAYEVESEEDEVSVKNSVEFHVEEDFILKVYFVTIGWKKSEATSNLVIFESCFDSEAMGAVQAQDRVAKVNKIKPTKIVESNVCSDLGMPLKFRPPECCISLGSDSLIPYEKGCDLWGFGIMLLAYFPLVEVKTGENWHAQVYPVLFKVLQKRQHQK